MQTTTRFAVRDFFVWAVFGVVFGLLGSVSPVLAQDGSVGAGASGVVGDGPAGGYGLKETADKAGLPNTDTDIIGLVGVLIGVALGLVGVMFFVLMVYGGFLWMTSRGNTEQVGKAKTLIVQSIVGGVIIVAAWAITNFVIGALQGV